MGTVRPPRRVKLICGMIYGDEDLMRRAQQLLVRAFGAIDAESEVWPFDATDYYEPEMGPDLRRRFVAFAALIDPGRLASIKRETNALEGRLCRDSVVDAAFRVVNLDPGYIGVSKLVLATTKDYSHRVYVSDGIYAEVTLQWKEHRWQSWPWTDPDYADTRYHSFFTRVRERLRDQLSGMSEDAEPRSG
jgi:hypothetical protein